jgi:flagellar assembly protein FliH
MKSLSKSRIIKAPTIKKEVCYLDIPEPDFSAHELAAAAGELSAAFEETGASREETAPGEEKVTLPPDPEAVAAQLLDRAQLQAEEIVSAARREADLLLTETQERCRQMEEELAKAKAENEAECEELKKAAYEAGYQEGWANGQEEGEKAWAERINAAEATLDEAKKEALALINRAEQERTARIRDSEMEILKLAVEIAEKIINQELKDDPEQWLGMLRNAIAKVAGATEVTIRIAAEDEAFLIQRFREIRSLFTESPQIQIKTDLTLTAGDFVIQSNIGHVDARIHQQLTKIFQAIKEESGSGGSKP